ncbi:hypothetical protein LTR06_000652 [Exophiala xenobiotica]|nr:hypothetical protein LTR06_000652 [Exophiala xenobiotica]
MVAIKTSILLWASLATLTTAFPGQAQPSLRPGQGSNEVGPSNVMKAGGEHGGSGAVEHTGQGHEEHPHGAQGQDHGIHARDENGMSKHIDAEGLREEGVGHDEHRKGEGFGGHHPRDVHHDDHEAQGDHHAKGSNHTEYPAGMRFRLGSHPRAVDHDEHEAYEHDDDMPDPRFPHIYARGTQLGVYECAHQNWVLPCKWTPLKDGQCYDRLYTNMGSMGPDKGLTCTIYEQPHCNDKGWNTAKGFKWPGLKNYQTAQILADAGMQWGGVLSIICKHT